jgi:hypothetical protein
VRGRGPHHTRGIPACGFYPATVRETATLFLTLCGRLIAPVKGHLCLPAVHGQRMAGPSAHTLTIKRTRVSRMKFALMAFPEPTRWFWEGHPAFICSTSPAARRRVPSAAPLCAAFRARVLLGSWTPLSEPASDPCGAFARRRWDPCMGLKARDGLYFFRVRGTLTDHPATRFFDPAPHGARGLSKGHFGRLLERRSFLGYCGSVATITA